MDFIGKVVIVTGAVSGIGLQITRELLKDGVQSVTMLDVDVPLGIETLGELAKEFGSKRIAFIEADVRKQKEMEDAFEKTIATFGSLDIVVNNAGLTNEIDFELEIDTNLTGVVRGTNLGLKYMAKKKNGKGGVILNIGSVCAFEHQEIFPIYASTKGGILNMARGFGHPVKYAQTRVKVMTLCPAITNTPNIAGTKVIASSEELLQDLIESEEIQSAEVVGRAAVYAIKHGDSASVWVIEKSKLYRQNMPDWRSLRKYIATYDKTERKSH